MKRMMSGTAAERNPKRPRRTTHRAGRYDERRDDDDDVLIDGMDLLDGDASPVGMGVTGGDSNRVDPPSLFDVNDHGDIDAMMSVQSFEEEADEVEEAVAINAEVEEVVEEEEIDFVLGRDDDEMDTEMRGTQRNRHWRNMVWDERKSMFVYEMDGFDPVADNAIPKVRDWKKLYPRDMTEARVTFNQGKETLLRNYIDEHNYFKKRLDYLDVPKTREGLFDYLYGEQSRLATALTKALNIEYKELCSFLGTMYFGARLVVH